MCYNWERNLRVDVATATNFVAAGVEDGDEDEEKMPAPGVGVGGMRYGQILCDEGTSKIWCG